MTEALQQLILNLAQELHAEHEIELSAALAVDTPLFGKQGVLDSMSLVSLVIAVEQAIEERYEKQISLADEKAMSQSNSPYRNVASLAAYAADQLAAA